MINEIMNLDCIEGMKLMADGSVDAIITDPPYNLVEKKGGNLHLFRQSEVRDNNFYSKESMFFDTGFDQISWLSEANRVLKRGGHFIIFNDWENMSQLSAELKRLKVKVKCLGHWQKTNPQPAEWKRRFVTGREYFLHAIKNGKYTFNVDSLNKGVFEMGLTKMSEKKHGRHPNQKPLDLMEEIIRIVTNEGDVVLDCFAGSGSTNVACKNTNRNCIGIELDQRFSEIARKRLK